MVKSSGWLFLVMLVLATVTQAGWVPFGDAAEPAAPELTLTASTKSGLTFEVAIPGMITDTVSYNGKQFDVLEIPGEGLLRKLGEPQIPVIGRMIAIPDNSGVTVRVLEERTLELENYLVTPAVRKLRSGAEPEFVIDERLYQAVTKYPGAGVELGEPGIWRDYRVVRIQLNPIRFQPSTGKLTVVSWMKVEVRFSGSSTINAKVRKDPTISASFEQLYRRTLLNYEQFKRDVEDIEPLLVIAHDSLVASMEPFIEWKNQKGIPVTVALTSEVGSTASAIKAYIQNAYDTWTPRPVSVMLIGDAPQIPTNYGIESCASDYMYTTLEGSDIDPDMFIGRLVAQTLAEVDNQVAKFVNYEQALSAQTTWHDKGIGISSSSTGPAGINDDTRLNNVRTRWLNWGMVSVDQLYVSNGGATVANVSNAVNEGRAWLTYMGHGSGTSWSTPSFTNTHVDQLQNGDRLPFLMDVSCLNGGFTGSGDCFAERWMKVGTPTQQAGAVGMYSASTSTAWDESGELGEGVTYAYVDDALYSTGAAAQGGLLWLESQMGSGSNVLEVFQQYVLFGDPSLVIYTDEPQAIQVTHPEVVPMGAIPAEFVVTSNGQPVAGALVCARKGDEFTAIDRTNASGVAVLTLTPETIGDIDVTVTGLNLQPYNGTMMVLITGCGVVIMDKSLYACDQLVTVSVWDADLNVNPGAPDTAMVLMSSNSEPLPEAITLVETGNDTNEFSGAIQLSTTQSGVGYLLVSHDDSITAVYQDADCDGVPVEVQDTAGADCIGPTISSVMFSNVMDSTATITWTSDEASTSIVYYGFELPPTLIASDSELTTTHEINLTELTMCSMYYFMVASEDISGNVATDDNGGQYYAFNTLGKFVVLDATMDENPLWTITGGQWAWGQPTGSGGQYGNPDPTSGYTGLNVYGYNLNGDYGASIPAYHLVTPAFDCSGAVGTKLAFYRFLGVESNYYDHAIISVSTDGVTWNEIFHNSSTITDSQWTPQEFDISSYADGEATVYLRWTMGPTDYGWQYCGWNIDDVEVSYLSPCNVPVLLQESRIIDDSTGNNNGQVNPGESIVMPMTLVNDSGIDATNVEATIATTDPHITITNDHVVFPDLPGHVSAESLAPHFAWSSDAQTPDNTSVLFTVNWQATEGSGSFSFNQPVVTPILEYSRNIIDDASGNGDGKADPGEAISLPLFITNTGHDAASNVTGALSTESPLVTITSGLTTFPDMAPGVEAESLTPHVGFSVSGDAPIGTVISFDLELAADGYSWSAAFDIIIGLLPVLLIDDCSNCPSVTQFTAALEAQGFDVGVETPATTDPALWTDYAFLVWVSGNNYGPIATLGEDLISYVQGGGKVLVEGGEVAYDHQGDTIATEILHIQDWYTDSSGSLDLEVTDHPLATTPYTLPSTIAVLYSSYGDQDACIIAESAVGVFGWTNNSYHGVITYDADGNPNNGGQIVFFSFNLNAVSVAENRTMLVANAAAWLQGLGSSPPTPTQPPTQPPTLTPTATPTRTPTLPPTATEIPTDTPSPDPTETPVPPTLTPTASPTATPTTEPTASPTESPTPVLTETPEPEPSPTPGAVVLDLILNSDYFRPNDLFELLYSIVNPGPALEVELYIILDVYGIYFFYPTWTQDLDNELVDLPAYDSTTETVLSFTWPAGAGSANDIMFWGGMLEPGTVNLVGDIDYVSFGWGI